MVQLQILLKGRLRRALSLNAVEMPKEEDEEGPLPSTSSAKEKGKDVRTGPVVDTDNDAADASVEGSVATKRSLRLFIASADSIFLSSTFSSGVIL